MAERATVKALFIPGQLVLIQGLTPRPELNCRPSPVATTCTNDALSGSRLEVSDWSYVPGCLLPRIKIMSEIKRIRL